MYVSLIAVAHSEQAHEYEEALKSKIAELEKTNQALQDENKQLQAQIDTHETALNAHVAEKKQQEAAYRDLAASKEQMQSQITNLEGNLSMAEAENLSLAHHVTEVRPTGLASSIAEAPIARCVR